MQELRESSACSGTSLQCLKPVDTESILSPSDRSLLAEATEGFVPERVFDAHGHLHGVEFCRQDGLTPYLRRNLDLLAYRTAMNLLFPDRTLEGALLFPFPIRECDRVGLNSWMFSELGSQNSDCFPGLALAAPNDNPKILERLLHEGGALGLKPYHYYSGDTDTLQAHVEAFVPEWMWELCHRYDGILMIHLMRDGGISDPDNLKTLARLCEKYPRCQVILPHIARSFNFRTARGLKNLANFPNIWVDTSAITEAEGIRIALDVLGPQRILFGSDYPISHLRGHCATAGATFHWFYGDEVGDSRITLVGIDSLLSLRRACESVGLTRLEIKNIFSGNAKSLLRRESASN